MSCILYSKASYLALAKTPIVQAMWRDRFAHHYDSAESMMTALHELNVRAYCTRYEREDYDANMAVADLDLGICYEFCDLLDCHSEPLVYAELYHLLGRIEYQCCDIDDPRIDEMYNRLQSTQD